MIELLRIWHHTWNPYVDGLVSIILFLGGYTAVMLTIAIASYKIGERKKTEDAEKLLFPDSVEEDHEGKKDKHEKTSRCNRDRRINDK